MPGNSVHRKPNQLGWKERIGQSAEGQPLPTHHALHLCARASSQACGLEHSVCGAGGSHSGQEHNDSQIKRASTARPNQADFLLGRGNIPGSVGLELGVPCRNPGDNGDRLRRPVTWPPPRTSPAPLFVSLATCATLVSYLSIFTSRGASTRRSAATLAAIARAPIEPSSR